jgi:hypothetical protein
MWSKLRHNSTCPVRHSTWCLVYLIYYRIKVGNETSSESKLNGLAPPDPVRIEKYLTNSVFNLHGKDIVSWLIVFFRIGCLDQDWVWESQIWIFRSRTWISKIVIEVSLTFEAKHCFLAVFCLWNQYYILITYFIYRIIKSSDYT